MRRFVLPLAKQLKPNRQALTVLGSIAGAISLGLASSAHAQSIPVSPVLRKAPTTPSTAALSALQRNYTEIVLNVRTGGGIAVTNRRGILGLPAFGSAGFTLMTARWSDASRTGRDGFFVGRSGVIGKRLLDRSGNVAGAYLMSRGASELLIDSDRDNIVDLSVLTQEDGFARITFAGEAGRAAFDRMLSGQNPFCVGGPRHSTPAERARGDASGCPGTGSTTLAGTGAPSRSGSRGKPPRDPMDFVCAGFDPVRARFSGGTRSLDPDNPLPATQGLLDFASNGFDGERDQLAAAGRFVIMSPLIGLVAILEFSAHEVAGGGQLGLIAEARHRQIEAEERRREAAASEPASSEPPAEGSDTTPPPTSGGDTSRPGPDGGDDLGGPLSVACGSRSAPSQSASMRTAFDEALNKCPNPDESTAAAGEATASCMSGVITSRNGSAVVDLAAMARGAGSASNGGCPDSDPRCLGDRTGRLRGLLQASRAYLGQRAICDPRNCQPPLQ